MRKMQNFYYVGCEMVMKARAYIYDAMLVNSVNYITFTPGTITNTLNTYGSSTESYQIWDQGYSTASNTVHMVALPPTRDWKQCGNFFPREDL